MTIMKCIVGLGNPGPQYVANRHNIGFQCLELFSRRHRIDLSKLQQRAMTGDGWIEQQGQRQRVLLVKPLTYMNLSGQAVVPLLRFYKIDLADLIVIHDDIDLAQGKLRLRMGGSSGGQNGIKSIIDQAGSQEFARVKVGVGRPPGKMDPAAFVLQNFTAAEEEIFTPLRDKVVDALHAWLFAGLTVAMNRFNG
ncbi:MAG: aminoacyl-tRNA hydrolase [Caldilineaceae bacterium]|nr:aminoacyl-tRNA hydrolase [Caldilineaceae bacterium]